MAGAVTSRRRRAPRAREPEFPPRSSSTFSTTWASSPKHRPREDRTELVLHNCPFRELVDRYHEVACAVHRGLIEGVITPPGSADPVLRVELTPFVSPGQCLVGLSE